jgi:outer membrane protein TolC
VKPETKAPFHNQVAARPPTATATPALDSWWTGFNDPMLITVVQCTLYQNLDFAASLARVQAAKAAAKGAGAALLFTINNNGSATAYL